MNEGHLYDHAERSWTNCPFCRRRRVRYRDGQIMHRRFGRTDTARCPKPLLTRVVQWLNTAIT